MIKGVSEIEITRVDIIEGGVQVFARAWDLGGGQIGFGRDGSVDIERFRLFNPPVLVDDVEGTITRTHIDTETGKFTTRTLREDPKSALLESLVHTISVKKEKFGADNIVPNKTGNTTTTVYPDTGTGGTTGDAWISSGYNATWAGCRSDIPAAGYTMGGTKSLSPWVYYRSGSPSWYIRRSGFTFDTSAVGSDIISSVVLSLHGTGDANADADSSYNVITGFTPAADNSFVRADYSQHEFTPLSSAIDIADYSTSDYNDYAFNSAGIAYINGSGVTGFSHLNEFDLADTPTPTGSTGVRSWYSDEAGTSKDPKLVIEHSSGSGPDPQAARRGVIMMG